MKAIDFRVRPPMILLLVYSLMTNGRAYWLTA